MKVLIVDDEPPARDRLRQLLDESGEHEIVGEAGNGREALEVAARTGPDVVLLDIEMPRMDGYELTRHIRRSDRLKDIPLIMITSRTGEKHRRYAMGLGRDR